MEQKTQTQPAKAQSLGRSGSADLTASNTNPVQLEAASSLSAQGRKAPWGSTCRVGGTPGGTAPRTLRSSGQGPFGQGPWGVVPIVFVPLKHRLEIKHLVKIGGCWSSSSPSSSSPLTCIRGEGSDGKHLIPPRLGHPAPPGHRPPGLNHQRLPSSTRWYANQTLY